MSENSHITQFIALADDKFTAAITKLAAVIEKNDCDLVKSVQKMMHSDAIMYSQQDIMKYAITCHNKHISLHLMPIYCYAELHDKYKQLIKTGRFQKGCVNFSDIDDMPYEEIGKMIAACAAMPYPTQYQLDKN